MIFQAMKMSMKSILSNKLRSFLTMLGIIIGVFALVVLVSLVSGATGTITDSINSLGSNLISVTIWDDHGAPMKLEDVEALADDYPEIALAAPTCQSNLTAAGSYTPKTAQVTGTTNAYAEIENLQLESGRFIMTADVENHTNVVVVSSELATEVLGRTDVVGETIRLGGREFLIIGVLAEDDSALSALMSGSYTAYVPYTTLVRLADGVSRDVVDFYVSAEPESIDEAETVLNEYLMDRFDDDDDAYYAFNQSSIADTLDTVTGVLSLVLGGIAAISLLVGGIGIMNIMLVSVTERTREIGIRKAIGAGRGTILLQFLIEALMVSLVGCALGLLLSALALWIIGIIGDVSYGVQPGVAVAAVAFSMAIGVLFGLYPGQQGLAHEADRRPAL